MGAVDWMPSIGGVTVNVDLVVTLVIETPLAVTPLTSLFIVIVYR
jgi:hypothetical protein